MIGIRLADHSLYPVFQTEVPGKKRVVLTTVRDGQERAQIDLYRFDDPGSDAEPLAHLEIDGLVRSVAGRTDLEFDTSIDADGNLTATVSDRVGGMSQSTAVPGAVPGMDQSVLLSKPVVEPDQSLHRRGRRKWLAPVTFVVALMIAAGVWLVLSRGLDTVSREPGETTAEAGTGESDSGAEAASGQTTQAAEASSTEESAEESAGPAQADRAKESTEESSRTAEAPAAAESSTEGQQAQSPASATSTEPAETSQPEVEYRIIWGDTLWDISEAFYGTPWMYPEIAEENEIRNPDLIYAQDLITIPERD